MAALTVRDAAAEDEEAFRRLWEGYIRFYRVTVAEAVTAITWARILDPAAPVFARLADRNGSVAGFSVCILHAGTWTERPLCYLEDLFVDPTCRGQGIGRALIEDLITLAKTRGWSRLYWHTEESNRTARRLYDHFAATDGFVRYRLFFD